MSIAQHKKEKRKKKVTRRVLSLLIVYGINCMILENKYLERQNRWILGLVEEEGRKKSVSYPIQVCTVHIKEELLYEVLCLFQERGALSLIPILEKKVETNFFSSRYSVTSYYDM